MCGKAVALTSHGNEAFPSAPRAVKALGSSSSRQLLITPSSFLFPCVSFRPEFMSGTGTKSVHVYSVRKIFDPRPIIWNRENLPSSRLRATPSSIGCISWKIRPGSHLWPNPANNLLDLTLNLTHLDYRDKKRTRCEQVLKAACIAYRRKGSYVGRPCEHR